MDFRPILSALLSIIIIILIALLVGYGGRVYSMSYNYTSCGLGMGGECGFLGNCEGNCMESVKLCWIPVKEEIITE